MALTTYGDIGNRTAGYVVKKMLEHAEPVLILQKFGEHKPVPRNKTQTVKFRRPNQFPYTTTPLTEGVTPTSANFSYTDLEVTLSQYGTVAQHTDHVEDTSEDPVVQDTAMMLGEQAGLSMEMVLYGVLKAGTNVVYANGSSRSDVNSVISLSKQQLCTRTLDAQKAKKITKVLSPSVMIGTRPVEAAYVAVAHTDLDADIRNMPGFISVAEYGNRQPICAEELGSVNNVRYILSPELVPYADAGGTATTNGTLSSSGSQSDVYPVLIFGQHAYGLTPLKGKDSLKPVIINANNVDSADPLGQRGYVGWKTWFAGKILNDAWLERLEVAVSAL